VAIEVCRTEFEPIKYYGNNGTVNGKGWQRTESWVRRCVAPLTMIPIRSGVLRSSCKSPYPATYTLPYPATYESPYCHTLPPSRVDPPHGDWQTRRRQSFTTSRAAGQIRGPRSGNKIAKQFVDFEASTFYVSLYLFFLYRITNCPVNRTSREAREVET